MSVETFRNREAEYLTWVHEHPTGFIANVGADRDWPQYPMLHLAKHKAMWSPSRTNYTSGDYFKACAESVEELEAWSNREYRRGLTRCGICFKYRAMQSTMTVDTDALRRPRAVRAPAR